MVSTLALVGAPFLAIGFYGEKYAAGWLGSGWYGFYGILYISGWAASVVMISHLKLTGSSWAGRALPLLTLLTLLMANVSNVWTLISSQKTSIFWVLDAGWPISNLLMLPLGAMILFTQGTRRMAHWAPLLTGCWLPLSVLVGEGEVGVHVSSMYSALAWLHQAWQLSKLEQQRSLSF